MVDHRGFHQARADQQRRRAEALAPGPVRKLHDKLADLHRDMVLSLSTDSNSTMSGGAHQQR